MKRATTLVLFTANFPFGRGEEFLESEIPYLSAALERVLLVPNNTDGAKRVLPDNVMVDTSVAEARAIKPNLLLLALKAVLLSPEFYRELMRRPRSLISPKSLKHLASKLAAAYHFKHWLKMNFESGYLQENSTLFYSYWFDTAALGLSIYSKTRPIRFISRIHGYDLYDERNPIGYLPFRPLMFQQVQSVFSVSNDGQQYLQAKQSKFADKIHVARLGVTDPEWTTPASSDGILRIVSCSFIVPVKRLPLLIQGLQAFAEAHPSQMVNWDHIGSGPQEDEVIKLTNELLPKNVARFFHGHLTNQSVLDFYRNNPIDGFINVSESEGIPVSIMEAQSFGIPVIATAVGGVPEIVNNKNGILLPPDPSPDDIASSLTILIEAEETTEKRTQSKASWQTRFNASNNYTAFVERITEVLGSEETVNNKQPKGAEAPDGR